MRRTAFAKFLAGVVLLAACDRATKLPEGGDPAEIRTIASLKSQCVGQSTPIRQDLSVRGVVTANDAFGEFYKMLVIEDRSGGISIAVDRAELFLDYPVGCELTVRCNGLTLCNYGGKVQLGTEPRDDAPGAGRIPEAELGRYLVRSDRAADPVPAPVTIPRLEPRLTDTYVRLEGVRFTEESSWCDTDPLTHRTKTTERQVVDGAGNTFRVRTLGTCIYAKEPVPQGTGSLNGILDCFDGRYSLRVVNRETEFTPPAVLPTACP